MPEGTDSDDIYTAFEEFGEVFGLEDPLKEFDKEFKQIDADAIQKSIDTKIKKENIIENRRDSKIRALYDWKEHMAQFNRHYACPHPKHVIKFIEKEIEKGNSRDWTISRIKFVEDLFDHWANHPMMPHGKGDAKGFNPIETGLQHKQDQIKAIESEDKSQHRIPLSELSRKIRQIKNIFRRAVLVTQFKYGIRGGQSARIQIQDININNSELKKLYPQLGTHRRIKEIDEEAIYFPSRQERPGVKSKRPTIVPIDGETKYTLIKYLQVRPPIDKPWLFLNPSNSNQLNTDYIRNSIWKKIFHPEYEEKEDFEAVGSHYARHKFTTYFDKETNINRVRVKYMRGDKTNVLNSTDEDSLYDYVHAYYEDIREPYLSNIYKFNL